MNLVQNYDNLEMADQNDSEDNSLTEIEDLEKNEFKEIFKYENLVKDHII